VRYIVDTLDGFVCFPRYLVPSCILKRALILFFPSIKKMFDNFGVTKISWSFIVEMRAKILAGLWSINYVLCADFSFILLQRLQLEFVSFVMSQTAKRRSV